MLKSLALGTLAAVALTVAPMTAAPAAAQTKDIVDTAVAAGSFKTLAAALQAAGLIETLKGPGPFTVFAPTDEAFAKLPAGTRDAAQAGEQGQADAHPHLPRRGRQGDGGRRRQADVGQGGQRRHADDRRRRGGVTIDKAKVVKADIAASNGVIHVIDTVILPKDS